MICSLRVFGHSLVAISLIAFCSIGDARADNRDWNTGNGNWNVPGNWTPNGAPDNGTPVGVVYNVQIGNLPAALNAGVTFVPVSGTSDTVSTLTVSNGADLFTNGNQLNVLTTTNLNGVGTTIRIDPHNSPGTPSLQSLDLDLNSGGGLTMSGGVVIVSGELEINAGSVLGGHGEIDVGDFDLVAEQAFENSSLLQPAGNTAAPQTLTIHATGLDTIDLDGDSEIGFVDVDNAVANTNLDSITLVIDGPLDDPFGGVAGATLQIGQRDTLTFTKDFSIANAAAITLNGGNNVATMNGAGSITSITGASFTITGNAAITNNMTFIGTANTITVNANSSLELGGTVAIPDSSAINLTSNTSALVISGNTSINEAAGDFNWDGPGLAVTTVKGTSQLSLTVNHVDQGDDVYGGTLNLDDDGDVSVNNVANLWQLSGTIHKHNAGTSSVTGDAVNVSGAVVVDAAGTLAMPTTTVSSGSTLTVNGTLTLGSASVLAGPTSISGTGQLRLLGTSTVTANTTIGTTSFDWDGSNTGTLHTINNGVVFTINSTTFDSDGDMDDPVSVGGNAALNVNGVSNWTMVGALTTNAADVGTATIGGTARMKLSTAGATWFVSGNTNTTAPVTFDSGSSVATVAGRALRLDAGGSGIDANAITGGTISGPGTLAANTGRTLRGFGTIDAPVDFDGTAAIAAENGTLTINGAIIDVGTIGTFANNGILNIPAAWNSSGADFVNLNGGTLQGGAITVANTNGISGFGTITSRVVNNTQLNTSNPGQTLIFETAANDNDWDGGANTGALTANNGSTLELRDNATFTFGGTVTAIGGSRVYSKGFGFNFFNSSSINLSESTLQADETTTIYGAVNVAAGADSTINVQLNRFLDIKSTSTLNLNGNLRLQSNNAHIEAGATFTGNGAVIVPAGSHLVPEVNSNINTLLVNQGALRPADFDVVGRVDMRDYQQTDTGQLYVELTGTLLNQYDRMIVNGFAQLDGYLNIDIDEVSPGVPFVPALGNVFNIISATGGIAGTFDTVDVTGMPAGLTFHVNYTPTLVQLQVVNKPTFAADFDDDGDVDSTDYEIWRHAFKLNQLGDATGDNISDALDYVIWRHEFGSHAGAGSGSLADGAAVPEPSSVLLLLFGAAFLPFRRTR